jgi:thiol-disulfide isomerase/thioredoxin
VKVFLGIFVFLAACGAQEQPKTVTVQPLPTTTATEEPTQATLPQPTATPKGDTAPEVLAPNRVTVVHFFASWCAPCRKSIPDLDALYAKHTGHVAAIGIGEDDDESDMRAFAANAHASFTVLWDSAKAKAGRWKPNTMPTTYVVDKHGMLRYTHAGYREGDRATLETEVQSLLAEP